MAQLDLYTKENQKVGAVDFNDSLLVAVPHRGVISQVVRMQLANKRRGSASTKGRSEVSGGGKKPYRQKGTGRARRGTDRSPICVGGGTVFGPTPRSYAVKCNRKVSRLALKSVLTEKIRSGQLRVVDDLTLPEIKTKHVLGMLRRFGFKKALLVDQDNFNLSLSTRNIAGARYCKAENLNVFEVFKYQNVVVSRRSFELMNRVYS